MAQPVPPSDPAPAQRTLVGVTIGRYAVLSLVGAGGMGEVYRADDTVLKRTVALKRIAPRHRADPQYHERFRKEMERASALNHPNVASIYDVIEHDGEMLLIMELVEGVNLRRRLSERLRIDQFMEIGIQCCLALAAAHEKGVVHGDIKPENIMVTAGGDAKLLDFGLARGLPSDSESEATLTSNTMATCAGGTPAYMAPEVLLQKEADGRSDIFSLGVVFQEVLSGAHPFRQDTLIGTSDRVLHYIPPRITSSNPGAPSELDWIVAKMLAKNPEERYATVRDVAVDLRSIQRSRLLSSVMLPVMSATGAAARPAAGRRIRRAAMIALSAVCLAALVLVVLWLALRPGGPLPPLPYVAVLPFDVTGGDAGTLAFSDGLGEALNRKLTQLTVGRPLQVVPFAEARKLRGADSQQVQRELGVNVNLALSGNLRRRGTQVRVSLKLVNVENGRQLRSESVEGSWADPIILEDRVTEAVLKMLQLEVLPPERQALAARGTTASSAYASYLEALGLLRDYDKPENVQKAIDMLQQAALADPKYASGYAELGIAYVRSYRSTKNRDFIAKARDACKAAKDLDAELAAAHVCFGTLSNANGEFETAKSEFQRALDNEPKNDEAYRGLASAYAELGKPDEAEKTYQRAIGLWPRYWANYNWLGALYCKVSRYEDAARMFKNVTELNPYNVRGYYNLAGVYIWQGNFDEAIRVSKRSLAIRKNAGGYSNLGTAYYYLRRFEDAAQSYEEAMRLEPKASSIAGNLAEAYYWSPGKRDQAVEALKKALDLGTAELQVNPRDGLVHARQAKYHAMLGDKETALRHIQTAIPLADDNADVYQMAAVAYTFLGEHEKALELIRKALAAGFSLECVRQDTAFDVLQSDPKFQKMLRATSARR